MIFDSWDYLLLNAYALLEIYNYCISACHCTIGTFTLPQLKYLNLRKKIEKSAISPFLERLGHSLRVFHLEFDEEAIADGTFPCFLFMVGGWGVLNFKWSYLAEFLLFLFFIELSPQIILFQKKFIGQNIHKMITKYLPLSCITLMGK